MNDEPVIVDHEPDLVSRSNMYKKSNMIGGNSSAKDKMIKTEPYGTGTNGYDLYWLELFLKLYFFWCAACVVTALIIFYLNVIVDFLLEWEEYHTSYLDWIPLSLDIVSFIYLMIKISQALYNFLSWVVATSFDNISTNQLRQSSSNYKTSQEEAGTATNLKNDAELETTDKDQHRDLSGLLASAMPILSLFILKRQIFSKIESYLTDPSVNFPNVTLATLLRFILLFATCTAAMIVIALKSLIISTFYDVANGDGFLHTAHDRVLTHYHMTDSTLLYSLSKISLYLGFILFIIWCLIYGREWIVKRYDISLNLKYNRFGKWQSQFSQSIRNIKSIGSINININFGKNAYGKINRAASNSNYSIAGVFAKLIKLLFEFNKLETTAGVLGSIIIIVFLFRGYSFYFSFLAFLFYAISFIIWKFESTEHTFLELCFSSYYCNSYRNTHKLVRIACNKICFSCLGCLLLLFPLFLSYLLTKQMNNHAILHNETQYFLSKNHDFAEFNTYSMCSAEWDGISIEDMSYLSTLAYH